MSNPFDDIPNVPFGRQGDPFGGQNDPFGGGAQTNPFGGGGQTNPFGGAVPPPVHKNNATIVRHGTGSPSGQMVGAGLGYGGGVPLSRGSGGAPPPPQTSQSSNQVFNPFQISNELPTPLPTKTPVGTSSDPFGAVPQSNPFAGTVGGTAVSNPFGGPPATQNANPFGIAQQQFNSPPQSADYSPAQRFSQWQNPVGPPPVQRQNSRSPGPPPVQRQNSRTTVGPPPVQRQNSRTTVGPPPVQRQNSRTVGPPPVQRQNSRNPGPPPVQRQNSRSPSPPQRRSYPPSPTSHYSSQVQPPFTGQSQSQMQPVPPQSIQGDPLWSNPQDVHRNNQELTQQKLSAKTVKEFGRRRLSASFLSFLQQAQLKKGLNNILRDNVEITDGNPEQLRNCLDSEQLKVPTHVRERVRRFNVHFGVGNFHRSHQLLYRQAELDALTENLQRNYRRKLHTILNEELIPDVNIMHRKKLEEAASQNRHFLKAKRNKLERLSRKTLSFLTSNQVYSVGIELFNSQTVENLREQDFLYTLITRDYVGTSELCRSEIVGSMCDCVFVGGKMGTTKIMGSSSNGLHGGGSAGYREDMFNNSPDFKPSSTARSGVADLVDQGSVDFFKSIVYLVHADSYSMTVTEKGYCQAGENLDLHGPGLLADVELLRKLIQGLCTKNDPKCDLGQAVHALASAVDFKGRGAVIGQCGTSSDAFTSASLETVEGLLRVFLTEFVSSSSQMTTKGNFIGGSAQDVDMADTSGSGNMFPAKNTNYLGPFATSSNEAALQASKCILRDSLRTLKQYRPQTIFGWLGLGLYLKFYVQDQSGSESHSLSQHCESGKSSKTQQQVFKSSGLSLPPFTVLCCDNIPQNGALVQRLLNQFLDLVKSSLLADVETQLTERISVVKQRRSSHYSAFSPKTALKLNKTEVLTDLSSMLLAELKMVVDGPKDGKLSIADQAQLTNEVVELKQKAELYRREVHRILGISSIYNFPQGGISRSNDDSLSTPSALKTATISEIRELIVFVSSQLQQQLEKDSEANLISGVENSGKFAKLTANRALKAFGAFRSVYLGYSSGGNSANQNQNGHGGCSGVVQFPCTMVDRITPIGTAANTEFLEQQFNFIDKACVMAEEFVDFYVQDIKGKAVSDAVAQTSDVHKMTQQSKKNAVVPCDMMRTEVERARDKHSRAELLQQSMSVDVSNLTSLGSPTILLPVLRPNYVPNVEPFEYISALNDIEYVHHAMGRLGGDQSFTGDRLLLSQDIYKFLSKYQREAGAQLVFEFGGPNENHICIPSLFAYRCQFLGESLGRYADRILERYCNPAIKDKISRLLLDGSKKCLQWIRPILREYRRESLILNPSGDPSNVIAKQQTPQIHTVFVMLALYLRCSGLISDTGAVIEIGDEEVDNLKKLAEDCLNCINEDQPSDKQIAAVVAFLKPVLGADCYGEEVRDFGLDVWVHENITVFVWRWVKELVFRNSSEVLHEFLDLYENRYSELESRGRSGFHGTPAPPPVLTSSKDQTLNVEFELAQSQSAVVQSHVSDVVHQSQAEAVTANVSNALVTESVVAPPPPQVSSDPFGGAFGQQETDRTPPQQQPDTAQTIQTMNNKSTVQSDEYAPSIATSHYPASQAQPRSMGPPSSIQDHPLDTVRTQQTQQTHRVSNYPASTYTSQVSHHLGSQTQESQLTSQRSNDDHFDAEQRTVGASTMEMFNAAGMGMFQVGGVDGFTQLSLTQRSNTFNNRTEFQSEVGDNRTYGGGFGDMTAEVQSQSGNVEARGRAITGVSVSMSQCHPAGQDANSSHYIGAQSIEDEESQSHSADSVDIPPSVRDIRESSTGLELRTHTHHTTEASMRSKSVGQQLVSQHPQSKLPSVLEGVDGYNDSREESKTSTAYSIVNPFASPQSHEAPQSSQEVVVDPLLPMSQSVQQPAVRESSGWGNGFSDDQLHTQQARSVQQPQVQQPKSEQPASGWGNGMFVDDVQEVAFPQSEAAQQGPPVPQNQNVVVDPPARDQSAQQPASGWGSGFSDDPLCVDQPQSVAPPSQVQQPKSEQPASGWASGIFTDDVPQTVASQSESQQSPPDQPAPQSVQQPAVRESSGWASGFSDDQLHTQQAHSVQQPQVQQPKSEQPASGWGSGMFVDDVQEIEAPRSEAAQQGPPVPQNQNVVVDPPAREQSVQQPASGWGSGFSDDPLCVDQPQSVQQPPSQVQQPKTEQPASGWGSGIFTDDVPQSVAPQPEGLQSVQQQASSGAPAPASSAKNEPPSIVREPQSASGWGSGFSDAPPISAHPIGAPESGTRQSSVPSKKSQMDSGWGETAFTDDFAVSTQDVSGQNAAAPVASRSPPRSHRSSPRSSGGWGALGNSIEPRSPPQSQGHVSAVELAPQSSQSVSAAPTALSGVSLVPPPAGALGSGWSDEVLVIAEHPPAPTSPTNLQNGVLSPVRRQTQPGSGWSDDALTQVMSSSTNQVQQQRAEQPNSQQIIPRRTYNSGVWSSTEEVILPPNPQQGTRQSPSQVSAPSSGQSGYPDISEHVPAQLSNVAPPRSPISSVVSQSNFPKSTNSGWGSAFEDVGTDTMKPPQPPHSSSTLTPTDSYSHPPIHQTNAQHPQTQRPVSGGWGSDENMDLLPKSEHTETRTSQNTSSSNTQSERLRYSDANPFVDEDSAPAPSARVGPAVPSSGIEGQIGAVLSQL